MIYAFFYYLHFIQINTEINLIQISHWILSYIFVQIYISKHNFQSIQFYQDFFWRKALNFQILIIFISIYFMSQAQQNNPIENDQESVERNEPNPTNEYLEQVAQDQQEMKDQGQVASQNNEPRVQQQQPQEEKENEEANAEQEQNHEFQPMQIEQNDQNEQKPAQQEKKDMAPEQKQLIEQKHHEQALNLAKQQQPSEQSYRNYLQKQLYQMQKQTNNLQQIIQTKDQQLIQLKNHNESIEKNLKSLEKEKNMAERFLAMQRRNKDKLKQQYESISKKIEEYKEIGDISILKGRVEELQVLTSTLKSQIQLKKQELEREKKQQRSFTLQQNINAFDQLSQQNLELKEQFNEKIEQYKKKNDQLADQILRRQQQYQEQFHLYQRTIEDLTTQLQSARQMQNQPQQRSEHHSHISSNQGSNEHEIVENQQLQKQAAIYKFIPNINVKYESLMREFLKLESDYSTLKQNHHQLREKYFSAVRDSKISSNMNISKKQYQELLSKYNKAKLCLEKAILQNKELRSSLANDKEDDRQRVQKILKSSIDPQQQNPSEKLITNYHKILKERYEKLQHYISDFRNNLTNEELLRLTQQIKDKNEQLQKSKRTINQQKQQIVILQEEIQFKNIFIDQIQNKNKMLLTQNQTLGVKLQKNQDNINKYVELEQRANLYERDNIVLVQEISYYKTQSIRWNKLYEDLKVNYENALEEKANLHKNMESAGIGANQGLILETILQQEKKCQQCSKRSEKLDNPTTDNNTQTDNFNDVHYKQLIEVLKTLRKFPQKTKTFLSELETSKVPLGQLKKKLEEMQQKYNQKFKQLKIEKSQNDQWRIKTKQQIIKEFQDIRELIQTQKLQTALRTAKFLIEELQKDDEEGQQEQEPEKQIEKPVQQQGQMKE